MDNLLDYMDESFFLEFRALGHGAMAQFIWVYDRGVDLVALRRFQHELGKGLLGRRIERSPLPFGRARWVSWSPPTDLDVAERPRPRSELTVWADEQAAMPISPEFGPPWRLAVQPLVEGGAAVMLIWTHPIGDGLALNNAVVDAVNGTGVDLGYPPPHSRTKATAIFQDARQALRDLPRVAKALVLAPLAAKEIPLRLRPSVGTDLVRRDNPAPPARRNTDLVAVPRLPTLTVLVDTRHWDERAESLGGTSNSLLIGFTARMCARLNWLDQDGLADVMFPVNERTPGDTRGNALTSAALVVDPGTATDLTVIRAAVKAALTKLAVSRDRITASAALTPLVPSILVKRFQTILQRSASILCSHFGNLDSAVNRPDGTEADLFFARHARTPAMADPALLRKAGGILFPVISGRLNGRIYISVGFSDAAGSTTTAQLSGIIQEVLDEFGVTPATII